MIEAVRGNKGITALLVVGALAQYAIGVALLLTGTVLAVRRARNAHGA